MVAVLDIFKVDAADVRELLDEGKYKRGIRVINWDFYKEILKDAKEAQVRSLMLNPDQTISNAKIEHPLDPLNDTAFNAVLFYIFYPNYKKSDTHPKLNFSNEYPKADYVRDLFYGIKKTPKNLALTLAWLWSDHESVAYQLYCDLGLKEHADEHKQRIEEEKKEGSISDVGLGQEHPRPNSIKGMKVATPEAGSKKRQPIRFKYPELAEDGDNPFHPANVTYHGRNDERQQLDNFIKAQNKSNGPDVLLWAISGPSGAGKTRLVQHWMLTSDAMPEDTWEQLVLGQNYKSDQDHKPEYWEEWQPDYSTLIVIDYLHLYRGALDAILRQCNTLHVSKSLHHPVRILLIDHVFPSHLKDIVKDERIGMIRTDTVDITIPYFVPQALTLQAHYSLDTDTQKEQLNDSELDKIIPLILNDVAGEEVSKSKKEKALHYLRTTTGAYYPLFAVLIGYTLRTNLNADFKHWSRRKLIEQYFEKTQRLPWKYQEKEAHWASACVAVSTARRGIDHDLLQQCMKDERGMPLVDFNKVREYSRAIVSQPVNQGALKPFEPDILGETFFLLFIQALLSGHETLRLIYSKFFEMLFSGCMEVQTNDALQCMGFITRLARNLSSEDQDDPKTQKNWEVLLCFLNHKYFSNCKKMQWSASTSLGVVEIT